MLSIGQRIVAFTGIGDELLRVTAAKMDDDRFIALEMMHLKEPVGLGNKPENCEYKSHTALLFNNVESVDVFMAKLQQVRNLLVNLEETND